MNSLKINCEQEIKELYNNLISKVNIGLNNIIKVPYTKGIIKCIHKFVNIYINLNSYISFKRNKIWKNIKFLSNNCRKASSIIDLKYKTKNKENIIKIIFLIYMMIYIEEISILSNDIDSSEKFLFIKKLNNLFKDITSIVS